VIRLIKAAKLHYEVNLTITADKLSYDTWSIPSFNISFSSVRICGRVMMAKNIQIFTCNSQFRSIVIILFIIPEVTRYERMNIPLPSYITSKSADNILICKV